MLIEPVPPEVENHSVDLRKVRVDTAGWSEAECREIIRRHAGRDGSLLPVLHDFQAVFGFVPPQAIPIVAEELNLTRAEVHGVVTFYHDFRGRPPGRHVLKLCRAEACQAMNGEEVARQILERFDLSWGGTTPDGRLTIEPVYCLGLCSCAPSALLDGEPFGRVGPASFDDVEHEVTAP